MQTPRFVYFRGEFVPFEQAKVSVMTHGLNYGTGCFEGIRAYWNPQKGELFILEMRAHFERLKKSAHMLYMDFSESVDDLCRIALELVKKNGYRENIYIRPLVYMGDELIGVRLHDLHPELAMFCVPMGDYVKTDGLKVCVSSWRRIDDNAVPARAKITGAYINSALAKTEAVRRGYDEAIFLNPDGHVSEGSAMNIFLLRDGQLITPAVNHNILEGVTRRAVMELARKELGLETHERSIDRTELYVADEVFFCGTGAQIAAVVNIDDRAVGTGKVGPVTRGLMEAYRRAVRGEADAYLGWVTPVYQEKKIELPAMPALKP